MAQRAIIGINGELSPFDESLAKLRTPGIGGDSITWVPHNDTLCAALTVRANGTYNAADKGVYGFDYVAVSVPGESVTGKDPTTGQEVVVSKDPDTGEIVETVVPTEIRVITPPTFTGPYGDGAYIDFTGLTVAAYDANGNKMQDVPFDELLFPVTVTKYDPSVEPGRVVASSDLPTRGVNQPIEMATTATVQTQYGTDTYQTSSGRTTGFLRDDGRVTILGASASAGSKINGMMELSDTFAHNGKTVYFTGWSVGGIEVSPKAADFDPGYSLSGEVAWTMIYGEITIEGGYQIPVQWSRTGDGAILETSFNIQVQSA